MTDVLREVVVADVPAQTYLAADRHFENLVAELRLVARSGGGSDGGRTVPSALVDAIEGILSRYVSVRSEGFSRAEEAVRRGELHLTLRLVVPESAPAEMSQLLAFIEQAEGYCGSELLTLPPGEEIVALRRKIVAEIAAQLEEPAAG